MVDADGNITTPAPTVVVMVNYLADDLGTDGGDCTDGSSTCTLRRAMMNGMDSQGLWVVELPGGIYTWNAGAHVTVTGTMRLESSDGEPVVIDGDGNSLKRFAEVDGGRLEVGDGVVFRNFEVCRSSCNGDSGFGGVFLVKNGGELAMGDRVEVRGRCGWRGFEDESCGG